jgi:RND family efflux transporter MFP subunit
MNSASPNVLLKSTWFRIAAFAGVVLAGVYLFKPGAKGLDTGLTFTARRGPLDITVLQGGSIESEENGEIKCEVKGGQGVKILKIVEEGYQVSEEDVKTNKVLVELDSADLGNKITQQEITFGSTVASLTDAQQAYDIQLNQNLSDVKAAEQKAAFARMDFEKYMGDQAALEILAQLGIKTDTAERPAPVPTGAATETAAATNVTATLAASTNAPAGAIDWLRYADLTKLGDGEAKQKLREAQDAVQIAQKELQQAQSTLEGTRRLFDKDFVTKIELDKDQLAYDNSVLKVKKAETALSLFTKYEFRRGAEEALSKYLESLRELDRTRKGAVSKLAQADAKLKSAQAKHGVEERQLKELTDQLGKCTIRARRPGLVVYGSGGEVRYWRDEEQIREGATIREGQTVLTIPDLRKTCIKVRIHEAYIKKVLKGQRVVITADAFPDRTLEGEVSQVGVLPDSESSWLNPDMKVYRTTITIKAPQDWIRPGMSAKVQILVKQLTNAVHIPVQSVSPMDDKKVCYVVQGAKLERREVEVGEFNDEFIEIRKGLKAGDRVSLRAQTTPGEKGASQRGKKAPPAKEQPKQENSVVSAAAKAAP